jgi:predicted nuclease of predicted toxin-antitoxin system
MKWLADENIPNGAIAFLRRRGQEVFSVAEITPGAPDQRVIQISVERQCILLSFDRDHGDLIFGQAVMPPPAVVYLRLYPPNPEALKKVLSGLIELGEDALTGQFTVVTLDGIRQRTLPTTS